MLLLPECLCPRKFLDTGSGCDVFAEFGDVGTQMMRMAATIAAKEQQSSSSNRSNMAATMAAVATPAVIKQPQQKATVATMKLTTITIARTLPAISAAIATVR